MQPIVTYENLKQAFGGTSPADVAVRLKKNNVPFLTGKNNRPFTTIDALNTAMGIKPQANQGPTMQEQTITLVEV